MVTVPSSDGCVGAPSDRPSLRQALHSRHYYTQIDPTLVGVAQGTFSVKDVEAPLEEERTLRSSSQGFGSRTCCLMWRFAAY